MSPSTFQFPTLTTPRLTLRELTLNDAPAVLAHFADPDVTRHLDIDACRSLAEAEEIVRFHVEDTGCRWGLFERATGALIGTCGYHCWAPGPPGQAEIGYDLARAHWGKGLMTEALTAAISFGFEAMGLARIEATSEPPNARSLRLLARLGFRRDDALRDGLVYCWLAEEDWVGNES